MVSAVCGGIRVVSLYAPNGRVVDSPFYEGKLRWFERVASLAGGDPLHGRAADPGRRLQRHAGARGRLERGQGPRRHPRLAPGARRAGRAPRLGPDRRLPRATPGDGPVLVVGLPRRDVPPQRGHADRPPVRDGAGRRSAWCGPRSIARRARGRRPRPTTRRSSIDLDEPGKPFDAGWAGALERIAAQDEAPPLTARRQAPGARANPRDSALAVILRGPRRSPEVRVFHKARLVGSLRGPAA